MKTEKKKSFRFSILREIVENNHTAVTKCFIIQDGTIGKRDQGNSRMIVATRPESQTNLFFGQSKKECPLEKLKNCFLSADLFTYLSKKLPALAPASRKTKGEQELNKRI